MNKLEDDNSSFCRLCLEDEDLYKEGVDPALVEEILRVDVGIRILHYFLSFNVLLL